MDQADVWSMGRPVVSWLKLYDLSSRWKGRLVLLKYRPAECAELSLTVGSFKLCDGETLEVVPDWSVKALAARHELHESEFVSLQLLTPTLVRHLKHAFAQA